MGIFTFSSTKRPGRKAWIGKGEGLAGHKVGHDPAGYRTEDEAVTAEPRRQVQTFDLVDGTYNRQQVRGKVYVSGPVPLKLQTVEFGYQRGEASQLLSEVAGRLSGLDAYRRYVTLSSHHPPIHDTQELSF